MYFNRKLRPPTPGTEDIIGILVASSFLPFLSGQVFATIMMSMLAVLSINDNKFMILLVAALMGISFTLAFLFPFQRKLKWRSREMLELALQAVHDLVHKRSVKQIMYRLNALNLNIITEG